MVFELLHLQSDSARRLVVNRGDMFYNFVKFYRDLTAVDNTDFLPDQHYLCRQQREPGSVNQQV